MIERYDQLRMYTAHAQRVSSPARGKPQSHLVAVYNMSFIYCQFNDTKTLIQEFQPALIHLLHMGVPLVLLRISNARS
jgi:hypothetical protein